MLFGDYKNLNDAIKAFDSSELDVFRRNARIYFGNLCRAYIKEAYVDVLEYYTFDENDINGDGTVSWCVNFEIDEAGKTYTIDFDKYCKFKVTAEESIILVTAIDDCHGTGNIYYQFAVPVSFLTTTDEEREKTLERFRTARMVKAEEEANEKTRLEILKLMASEAKKVAKKAMPSVTRTSKKFKPKRN